MSIVYSIRVGCSDICANLIPISVCLVGYVKD